MCLKFMMVTVRINKLKVIRQPGGQAPAALLWREVSHLPAPAEGGVTQSGYNYHNQGDTAHNVTNPYCTSKL